MDIKPLTISAKVIQYAVTEMLEDEDRDIHGIAEILPDLTFKQAVQLLNQELVFEGDSTEGIRLVEKPAPTED